MSSQPVLGADSLQVSYSFKSKPEKVFRAWTDPAWLTQWFKVAPDYSTPIAEVDLRVGGRYRLGMQPPDGEVNVVGGEYRVVDAPRKLSFTWAWEAAPPEAPDMLVTVEFVAEGSGTRVDLRHERLPSVESRDTHLAGWEGCFAQLQAVME